MNVSTNFPQCFDWYELNSNVISILWPGLWSAWAETVRDPPHERTKPYQRSFFFGLLFSKGWITERLKPPKTSYSPLCVKLHNVKLFLRLNWQTFDGRLHDWFLDLHASQSPLACFRWSAGIGESTPSRAPGSWSSSHEWNWEQSPCSLCWNLWISSRAYRSCARTDRSQ